MSCILILQIVSFQGIALTAYLPYLKGRGFTRSFDDESQFKASPRHNKDLEHWNNTRAYELRYVNR